MPDVLIVEDDAAVARAHRRILEQAGFAVTVVENGLAALAEVQHRRFEAILLDLRMPFLEGRGFFDELSDLHPDLRNRVMFVTGNAEDAELRKFLQAAGRPVLVKPVEFDELVEAVRRVAEQAASPARARGPARVLVTDDDVKVRTTVRRYLVNAGYEVLEAADGKAALELLEKERVDLLVTDMYMPGVDGIELAIRASQAERPLPILGMSGGGYLNKDDVLELAGRVGVARTISKPFKGEELLAAVSDLLQPHD